VREAAEDLLSADRVLMPQHQQLGVLGHLIE
jgi:hypothetical protein